MLASARRRSVAAPFFRAWGNRRRGGDAARRHLPRRGHEPVRHGRRLFARPVGGDPRPGDRRAGATRSLISTKATFRTEPGPNDLGSSRYHLIRALRGQPAAAAAPTTSTSTSCTASTRSRRSRRRCARSTTSCAAGKVRYVGCSNFSGWHLMKSLAIVGAATAWPRYVAHQAYYSLVGRDYEWELMPLALDQRVGTVVWSPLGRGPPDRQGAPRPAAARDEPRSRRPAPTGAAGRGRVPLSRGRRARRGRARDRQDRRRRSRSTGCCSGRPWPRVIIGARNEEQLRENLGAVGWNLTAEQVAQLDAASARDADLSLLAPARGVRGA